jgi:hypothetical protein
MITKFILEDTMRLKTLELKFEVEKSGVEKLNPISISI